MPTLTPITDPENCGTRREDCTGRRYGSLVAVREVGRDKNGTIHWEFRCDCGNTAIRPRISVAVAKHPSCGCQYRRPHGQAAARQRYQIYAQGAQKRGVAFELTFEQFVELSQRECHYCGCPPSNEHNPRSARGGNNYYGGFVYNGIDRQDNKQGYTPANCVTSCYDCNLAKRGMGVERFYAWLDRIAAFRQ